ncbi:O-antigen ligase family protein [Marivirga sericea]|nr:O-antigen ligase family protein [Marivirga sericea]
MSLISHTLLSIPPTIFLFLISMFFLTLTLINKPRIEYHNILFIPILFIIYLLTTQPFFFPSLHRVFGLLCSFLYIVPVVYFGSKLKTQELEKVINFFIIFSFIILVSEGISRLIDPEMKYAQFKGVDSRWIYMYKFDGIMYTDSNATGLHIICLFFFILYWAREREKKFLFIRWGLIILLIFTFSRAAWLGAIIGLIYIYGFKGKYFKRFIIFMSTSGIIVAFLGIGYSKISGDISFLSKLYILETTYDYLKSADIMNLIFGVGFFKSEEVLGIYGHNIFIVFLLESGIIGLTFILMLFSSFVYYTRKKALWVLIPYLVTSFSAITTFVPYLYGTVGLIYLIEQSKLNRHKCK